MFLSITIGDPGLQDFFYFMRLQYVFLFALVISFFSMFHFFREGDRLSPFVTTVYLGGSAYLLQEQMWFYAEPLLVLVSIVGVFFLYAGTKDDHFSPYARNLPLIAFWYSFSICVKLSAALLIAIPLAIIFHSRKRIGEKLTDLFKFLGYSTIFLIVINIPALTEGVGGLFRLVQDQASNFWHYAVGHAGTSPAGWGHARYICAVLKGEFGLLFWLFPPSVAVSFLLADRRGKTIKATLLAMLVGPLLIMTQQRIHETRNVLPFYFLFILLVSTGIWETYVKIRERSSPRNSRLALLGILSVLSTDRIYATINDPPWRISWGFHRTLGNCREMAMDFFRKIKRGRHATSYSVGLEVGPETENHQHLGEVPLVEEGWVSPESFNRYVEGWRRRVRDINTIVIVRRTGRNFQLTNFILPELGLANKRFGNYFVFYHAPPSHPVGNRWFQKYPE